MHSSFWQMNVFTYLINSPNTDKYMFKVGQIISIDLQCLHKAFVLFVDTWFAMWKFLWWSRYLTWKIIWLLLDRFWELTLEIQFYVVDDTIFKYYFFIYSYLPDFICHSLIYITPKTTFGSRYDGYFTNVCHKSITE